VLCAAFEDLRRKQLVHPEELELHRIAADLCGPIHEAETALQTSLVVAGHLGNEARPVLLHASVHP
jgi:hypothetical protein